MMRSYSVFQLITWLYNYVWSHFVNSTYFSLLLNLPAIWDCKIVMAVVFTGSGHVKSVMVELLLSDSFSLDPFVIWVTGICFGFFVRTVSRGNCCHFYKHTTYLGPGEVGCRIQSGNVLYIDCYKWCELIQTGIVWYILETACWIPI